MAKKILCFFMLSLVLTSCVSKKKITYLQNIDEVQNGNSESYEPKLKPDDLLMIIVSAPDPSLAALAEPFNLPAIGIINSGNDGLGGGVRYQSYLIDAEGYIDFPVLGKLKLAGLNKAEAVDFIKSKLDPKYLKDPIINMRINNFKISVLGEVARPGAYSVGTERITLPEALALAGDMTIYGNRKNILVVREMEGVKTHAYIDITKADFINSPYYYLDQNDLIYVNPNRTKANSSAVGPNITVGISAISLLITIIALVTR
jgi:polysaccharide export outer membrane protein